MNKKQQEINHQAARDGAKWLCIHCAGLQSGEKTLILADDSTFDVALLVRQTAEEIGADLSLMLLPDFKMHGNEPSPVVAAAMASSDVIFCLTKMSLAHSQARYAATNLGARYLSLPDYSMKVISSDALRANFEELVPEAMWLAQQLNQASSVRVSSLLGTDIRFNLGNRVTNVAPGIVRDKGTLGSPPDAEVNIAPLEDSCNGLIVVDGSIPCEEIGLLQTPVILTFRDGRVCDITCEDENLAHRVQDLFDAAGPKARVLGEFGIGLNPLATLCGIMLEDEGTRGTVHFGIGSNNSIGGNNNVAFHLDFVMRKPSVEIDGFKLIDNGVILSKK